MPRPHLSFAPVDVPFVNPRFVPSGSIQATPRTIGGSIEGGISSLLGHFMGEGHAARLGHKFMAPLNDATPVGNVTGAEAGGREFYNGLTRGDARAMALGAGSFALSALPGPTSKVAKKVGKGMFGALMKDTSGAIRAWHGSPHDFDKFSMDKIGTGEGAQSFGHGLYFAENPDVARNYQRRLSRGDAGRLYEVNLKPNPEDFLHRDKTLAEQSPKVKASIENLPDHVWDWMGEEMENYGMNPIEPGDTAYKGHHLIRALEKYASEGGIADSIPFDDPRQHVSEYFRQQGLPGYAFLDQASRQAGAGTSNYVVFDDRLIDTLNKF